MCLWLRLIVLASPVHCVVSDSDELKAGSLLVVFLLSFVLNYMLVCDRILSCRKECTVMLSVCTVMNRPHH